MTHSPAYQCRLLWLIIIRHLPTTGGFLPHVIDRNAVLGSKFSIKDDNETNNCRLQLLLETIYNTE